MCSPGCVLFIRSHSADGKTVANYCRQFGMVDTASAGLVQMAEDSKKGG